MKTGITNELIPQNIAPSDVKNITVYSVTGVKLFTVSLGHLSPTNLGQKSYSFGAVADIHLQSDTASNDFIQALQYFNSETVAFICICGDLTDTGTATNLTAYKTYVNSYSPDIPVYAIAGNHEAYDEQYGTNSEATINQLMETYTGEPLYYSFTYQEDVFIMCGVISNSEGHIFATGELQWLYDTLEANRNKRCFVFEHVRPQDGCGNAYDIYKYDIWGGTEATVFESLMKHYHNVILFHGHSHLKFNLQTRDNLANYDNLFGCHSVHIPSLAVPRTGNEDGSGRDELYAESEGYLVDVYEDHVVLKGRDFVKQEFIPIAQYCLDTTLKIIEPNTFVDTTGTIIT